MLVQGLKQHKRVWSGAFLRGGNARPGVRSFNSMFARHPWLSQLKQCSSMKDSERILTFLSGHCAAGNLAGITRDWSFLHENDHRDGLEILLLNVGYSGIPHVLNTLTCVSGLGIKGRYILDDKPSSNQDKLNFQQKGEKIIQQVYREKSNAYRAKIKGLHPVLYEWVCEIDFGRIRARDTHVSPKIRQLSLISALAHLPSFHMFSAMIMEALNVGATVEEVASVLEYTELIWGVRSQAAIDSVWGDINKKKLSNREAKIKLQPEYTETPQDAIYHGYERKVFQPMDEAVRMQETKELLQHYRDVPSLPDWLRLCCLLAGHAAAGSLSKVTRIWSLLPESHHRIGLEALLQAIVFAGWPKILNAIESIWLDVGISPSALVELEEEKIRTSTEYQVRKDGEALFKLIYGKQCDPLRHRIQTMHPDIENIILEFAYGRVLSRRCPGLEVMHRELMVVACLSGQLVFPQLHSHLVGSLHCGATMDQLRGILDQTGEVWGPEHQIMVDGYWLDFIRKKPDLKS